LRKARLQILYKLFHGFHRACSIRSHGFSGADTAARTSFLRDFRLVPLFCVKP
jgi:hypothetical protein